MFNNSRIQRGFLGHVRVSSNDSNTIRNPKYFEHAAKVHDPHTPESYTADSLEEQLADAQT
ncbi:hypothetical protein FPOAC2_10273 [Fusarium poae]